MRDRIRPFSRRNKYSYYLKEGKQYKMKLKPKHKKKGDWIWLIKK